MQKTLSAAVLTAAFTAAGFATAAHAADAKLRVEVENHMSGDIKVTVDGSKHCTARVKDKCEITTHAGPHALRLDIGGKNLERRFELPGTGDGGAALTLYACDALPEHLDCNLQP